MFSRSASASSSSCFWSCGSDAFFCSCVIRCKITFVCTSSGKISRAGVMVQVVICSILRWVTGSKIPIWSISSPKNSNRTGLSFCTGKISKIPPRKLNCPFPSTISHRWYPARVRKSSSACRSYACPYCSVIVRESNTSRGMVYCIKASGVVNTTCTVPLQI